MRFLTPTRLHPILYYCLPAAAHQCSRLGLRQFIRAFAILFALSLVDDTPGATIEVPNDFPTVASAIAVADANDTILITDSETYVEGTLVFDKSLSLVAASGQTPSVVSDGSTALIMIAGGSNGTTIGSNDGGHITFSGNALARDIIRLASLATDSVVFENISLIDPLPTTSGVAMLAFAAGGNTAGVGSATFRDVNVDMKGTGGRAFRLATTAVSSDYTFERVDIRNVSDSQDPFILGVNATSVHGGTLNVVDSRIRGGVRSIYLFENASQPKWGVSIEDSLLQTRSTAGAIGIRIDLPDTVVQMFGSALVSSGICVSLSGNTRPVGDHGSTVAIDHCDLVSSAPSVVVEPPSTASGDRELLITNTIVYNKSSANNVVVNGSGSGDIFGGSHNNAFPGGYINFASSSDVAPVESPLYGNLAEGDFRYANASFMVASSIGGGIGSNRNFALESEEENLLPAFPGAEGFGKFAKGGRGGDVYTVTTLEDSGPGSLREAISTAAGPRTIVFAISGTIELLDRLRIQGRSNLTIAGQTSPGGITIKNYDLLIASSSNIVVRYIRSRLGAERGFVGDSIWILNSQDIIIDHCSTSWGTDEVLSMTHDVRNITVQHCLISEALYEPFPGVEPHSMGMLVANIVDGGVTLYRNLLAHNDRRSPRPGGQPGGHPGLRLDFVNNVIYDWGQYAGSGGLDDEHIRLNYVGNYLLAGPSTILSQLGHAFVHYSTDTRVYQQGNLIDSNRDGQLNGVNTGWSMFSNVYTAELIRFDFPLVPTLDAPSAYQSVLAEVGASHARDEVDWRIIGQVTGQTGGIISNPTEVGGYPVLENITPPLDSDGDGMADWWEDLRSLDRHNPEDRNDKPDDSGYTNLELYLDCLVDPACVGVLPGESWSVF